jgi:MYXO-CTERM domain-containing protein
MKRSKAIRTLVLAATLLATSGALSRVAAAAPVGACCQRDGSCVEVLETSCNGTFLGVFTSCDGAICPEALEMPASSSLSVAGIVALLGILAVVALRRRRAV